MSLLTGQEIQRWRLFLDFGFRKSCRTQTHLTFNKNIICENIKAQNLNLPFLSATPEDIYASCHLLIITAAYPEPYQRSKIERFTKTVNGY